MDQKQTSIIIKGCFGLIGWAITAYGAYLFGGLGPCLIAIGLPLMIQNW